MRSIGYGAKRAGVGWRTQQHPTPDRISLRSMRSDPPPSGEGEERVPPSLPHKGGGSAIGVPSSQDQSSIAMPHGTRPTALEMTARRLAASMTVMSSPNPLATNTRFSSRDSVTPHARLPTST